MITIYLPLDVVIVPGILPWYASDCTLILFYILLLGIYTQTSEEWWQEAYDLPTYPDSPLSSIHRDKNETGWLDMYPGYSNELKTILDLEVKQNFKMSCNYSGTPGAPPLDPCEVCISDLYFFNISSSKIY